MTDSEKIDFLGGQVNALLAFASAVIQTHPDTAALGAAYAKSVELQATSSLNVAVSEPFLKGQAQIRKDIKALFIAAAQRKGA